MQETSLIKVLKMLTTEELEAFSHYVKSPLFNKNKNCIKLLELLKPAAPDYSSATIESKQIATQLFKKGNNPLASLRTATSTLLKLLQNFLAFQKYQKDNFYQDNSLLEALQEKNLPKLVERNLKRIESTYFTLEKSPTHYYERYKITEFKITFQKSFPELKSKAQNLGYSPALEDFYTYSLWNKLEYWAFILNDLTTGRNTNYNQNLLETTIVEAQQYDLNAYPDIQLWYFLVLLLHTNDNQYFTMLKKRLDTKCQINISQENLGQAYTMLINYCNRKIVDGALNYQLEMFHLYTQMIEKKLLYIGNYIPARHIKNIVSVGLKSKAFEQTRKFIENYKTEVDPQIQEGVYHFNLGAWHFYQKQYDQALEHLIQVDKIDVYYDLDSQALLLKTYYELTDSNALLSFIGSYKNFVKNNKKIPKNRQKAYLNFINLTMSLFRIKALYGNKSPLTLKAKIQKTEPISDKAWLLEKVEELIQTL